MTCNDWNEPCCSECINEEQSIEGASRCDCKGCQTAVDEARDDCITAGLISPNSKDVNPTSEQLDFLMEHPEHNPDKNTCKQRSCDEHKFPPFGLHENPDNNHILTYIHCSKCIQEVSESRNESPESYARYSIGWSIWGIQLFCNRHRINIIHIDFEGNRFPSSSTVLTDEQWEAQIADDERNIEEKENEEKKFQEEYK